MLQALLFWLDVTLEIWLGLQIVISIIYGLSETGFALLICKRTLFPLRSSKYCRVQEGDRLTGYVINTETILQKYREDGSIVPPRFYNGVVRSAETVVLFNLGSDTAGLDCYLYPVQDMAAGSISVALGAGAHKAAFPAAVSAGDELALLASSRKCLLNGSPTEKRGFFQYTAAGDSKHPVTVEEHKSARLLFEFQEMQEGGDRF